MLPRPLVLPALLAASVAVPYAATNGPDWARDWRAGGKSGGFSTPSSHAGVSSSHLELGDDRRASSPQGPGALLYPTDTPLEGLPAYSVAEVLRMDVTKEWVYQHWARKSTATADLELFGVRVPLVTGTQLADVAGSLTYYFGHDGQVHKLSFRGRTGDTTHLVHLVAQRYGLARQPSPPGEQLFQRHRGADVISQLRTRPARVLWASSPHDSFDVELDLQRPETAKPITATLLELPPPPQGVEEKQAKPPQERSNATSPGGDDGPKVTDKDGWKLFFPRSRVPKPQVDSLDERRRLW